MQRHFHRNKPASSTLRERPTFRCLATPGTALRIRGGSVAVTLTRQREASGKNAQFGVELSTTQGFGAIHDVGCKENDEFAPHVVGAATLKKQA